MSQDYRVRLHAFEGPLDLLLHLIRRAEVDIGDIPVADIADQYVEHLQAMQRIDVDLAGEFLVMAATLMEIKSRMVMPPEERASAERRGKDDDEDPRRALIRQLLAYREFREKAEALADRREAWQARYPAGRLGVSRSALLAFAEPDDASDLEDVTVVDLAELYGRIAASVNFERLGEHRIVFDDTPIELHAADIIDRLDRLADPGGPPSLTLREVFTDASEVQRIGLFLATLELTRQRRVDVQQDDLDDDIRIVRRTDEEAPADQPVSEPASDQAQTQGGQPDR